MWQESHEEILREWKAKCFINLWLHTASMSSAALFTGTNSTIIKYMVSAITILSGILTVITRQMRPGELYQEYSATAKRYKALIRAIDTCLDLPMELRLPPDTFIEKIKNEINTLSTTQQFPPLVVMNSFEAKFGSIEQKMFGEDIVELIQHDIKTRKAVKKIRRQSVVNIHSFM